MFLRSIYDEKLAQAAYLIGCQRTGEAIVIDAERDVDRYLSLAAANGLRITAAAETHIHADFLAGTRELAETVGAKAYLSAEGGPEWQYEWVRRKPGGGAYPHQLLRHNDRFQIGQIELRVMHTPGHTPEHICFLVTDRGGGAAEPMGLVAGDFVFVGDLGRPDLLESAVGAAGAAGASARALFQSVLRFGELPDYLQVWPGHGAGSACGKALGAVPQTTVGYERRFSPAIRAATDEAAFVRYILTGQPEPPLYFARMKRENREGPRVLGALPRPRRISAEELARLDTGREALLDTRTWKEFRAGHVPGALYLPLNASFPTDAGSFLRADETVHLVVDAGRVEEAVRDLVRIGIDGVASWLPPDEIAAYAAAGGRLARCEFISAAEARARLAAGEFFALDVRRASEFEAGHLPGAKNVSHTRLAARLAEIPRDRPVLVNCKSGGRSARACSLLERNGLKAVNLEGGFDAWSEGAAPSA